MPNHQPRARITIIEVKSKLIEVRSKLRLLKPKPAVIARPTGPKYPKGIKER
jgi:hypothetical protein